jgi:hypothetical protein
VTARGIRMALALSALLPMVAAAQGHPAPAAEDLRELRRHHHGGDWWRITTDSARYEARVGLIDTQGLAGVMTRRNAPPAPERITWDSIVRIDLRKSHETRGKIMGTLLGTIAGFLPRAAGTHSGTLTGFFVIAGAVGGGTLGGMVGDAAAHERPLYVAPTPIGVPGVPVVAVRGTAPPEPASVVLPGGAVMATTLDSAATDTVARGKSASAPPVPPAPVAPTAAGAAKPTLAPAATARAIESACRRISSGNLLKIEGDFGTFCGYASSIGPEGLGGLRVETTRASVQSPGSVGWERVNGIDVYGNNAGRGALGGALAFGAIAGLIGIPIGQVLAGNGNDGGSGAMGITLACAGVGAGFGLVLGTLGGSLSSGWHPVYRRE